MCVFVYFIRQRDTMHDDDEQGDQGRGGGSGQALYNYVDCPPPLDTPLTTYTRCATAVYHAVLGYINATLVSCLHNSRGNVAEENALKYFIKP